MKNELQKLVAQYKNKKRDKKGRFTSGSGGIRFPKDFNWGRALPVILTVGLVGGYLVFQSLASTGDSTNWKLYWSDEFNGSSLDTSRWGAYHNTYGDGNKEEACLTPNNVQVSNGTLKIIAKKEQITCPNSPTDQFSSGFIGSRDSPNKHFYPAFARYEIRARVPHAQGLWPAFWLRHVDGSTTAEVDVMEYFHAQVPGKATQTLHLPAEVGRNVAKKSTFFETAKQGTGDWHTYSVDIIPIEDGTKAEFIYRIDGKETVRYTPPKFGWLNNYDKNKMFDIAVNMAVGGTWNGHPNDELGWSRYLKHCLNSSKYKQQQPCEGEKDGLFRAQMPATYEVDYVRVFTPVQVDSPVPEPPETRLKEPTNFEVTPLVEGVKMDWEASSDGRVTSYSPRYIRSDSANKDDGKAWTYPGRVKNTSQTITGLESGVSYDFQIRSTDDTNSYTSSVYTPVVTATPRQPEPTGLKATYYSRPSHTGDFVSRIDSNINFNWGNSEPVSGVGQDFGVRWTGQIVPEQTDNYTFILQADQGAHLWIDGRPLIDAQSGTPLSEKTGTVKLLAGQAYDFDLDFSDNSGNAEVYLYWQSPTKSKTIVPQSVFRPTVKSGLSGRYSSRGAVVKYYIIRNDKTVDFNWDVGSPDPAVPKDGFRVTWVGKIKPPTTGRYKLITYTDDGSQLWINNYLLKNDWTDHATKRNEVTVSLTGGKEYAITLRYYENKGRAEARLIWSGPGISESIIPESVLTNN